MNTIIAALVRGVGLDDGDVKQAIKVCREALVVLYVATELLKAVVSAFQATGN